MMSPRVAKIRGHTGKHGITSNAQVGSALHMRIILASGRGRCAVWLVDLEAVWRHRNDRCILAAQPPTPGEDGGRKEKQLY